MHHKEYCVDVNFLGCENSMMVLWENVFVGGRGEYWGGALGVSCQKAQQRKHIIWCTPMPREKVTLSGSSWAWLKGMEVSVLLLFQLFCRGPIFQNKMFGEKPGAKFESRCNVPCVTTCAHT